MNGKLSIRHPQCLLQHENVLESGRMAVFAIPACKADAHSEEGVKPLR
jgi:hypothetical protein